MPDRGVVFTFLHQINWSDFHFSRRNGGKGVGRRWLAWSGSCSLIYPELFQGLQLQWTCMIQMGAFISTWLVLTEIKEHWGEGLGDLQRCPGTVLHESRRIMDLILLTWGGQWRGINEWVSKKLEPVLYWSKCSLQMIMWICVLR